MATTYNLIEKNILGSNTTSVTFSSIPQTYAGLVLKMSIRSDAAGNYGANPFIRLNGDSSNAYHRTIASINSSSLSFDSSAGSASASWSLQSALSAGDGAGFFTAIEFYMPNYSNTTYGKIGYMDKTSNPNSSSSESASIGAFWYTGTSAISTILIDVAGNFVTDSSFYLYGLSNT